ncbi:MAG: UTP--glucose-1-phosphate uridylyltransferase GalU [Gammaproteobacteria bacterium]
MSTFTKLRKAIFPVAGLGTRFLPATKANPKEMLPIIDKPLIQYAVEEAIAAGITELIFVTNSSKRAIEDHFDSNYELESRLEEKGKYSLLSIVRQILPSGVTCVYIRQPQPRGLGHAVLCAKPIIADEPFAVLLADDLIDDGVHGCLSNMLDVYAKVQSSIIAVQEVAPLETEKYGIVGLAPDSVSPERIIQVVEKPAPAAAPSQLAAVGRYILTPNIFHWLENIDIGTGGEIQLTDAISHLLQEQPAYIYRLQGTRYDCGSKLGYLKATINYALHHPEVGKEFKAYLQQLTATHLVN